MKTRSAIHTAPGTPLIVDEVELPDPPADHVCVKLFSSGICHSQLHEMHNKYPRPWLLGHEGTGVVTQVGSDVKHLKEGDHAIVTWVPRTPFRGSTPPPALPAVTTYRGEPVQFPGVHTWSEETVVPARFVIRIGHDDPTDVSCIVGCAVLTGAGAVMYTAGVKPGDSVAVFGVGGVGASAIRMAALLQAYPIIAIDLRDDKLEFATRFGATHVANASTEDPVKRVVELTGGGVDFAFDAIGVRVTNEQILNVTRAGGIGAHNIGGMAVLIGIPGKEMTLDPRHFMVHQRQYRGSLGATIPQRDFPTYLSLHRAGKFPLDQLITKRYRLDQINEACDALHAGEILGRAIIEY